MMQRNSGGRDGGGAMAKSPVFIGGSKPKPTAFAAAAGGAYWGEKTTSGIRYRECLKNHAAAMGGSVTDGCGEFMPSGEDGSLEAFKCAACSCHRNFHRQEVVAENNRWTSPLVHPAMMSFDGGVGRGSAATDSSIKELNSFNVYQSSGAGNHHRTSSMVQPVMMSFGGGGGRGSTVTDSFNVFQSAGTGNHHSTSSMAHPMMVSFGGSGGGRGSAATDSFTKELKSFNVYQSSGAGNQHSN